MHYVDISTYQLIPYYASAHTQAHAHNIHNPFEDSEPTGLKVDIMVLGEENVCSEVGLEGI